MKHPIVVPHLGATGGDVKIVEWRVAEGRPGQGRRRPLRRSRPTSRRVEVEAFRDGVLGEHRQPRPARNARRATWSPISPTADEPIDEAAPRRRKREPRAAPSAGGVREKVRRRRRVRRPGQGRTRWPTRPVSAEQLIEAFAHDGADPPLRGTSLSPVPAGPGARARCTSARGRRRWRSASARRFARDDLIYSTHRPVGHLIAKGASLDAITAEIWGKATGCVGGKGGQMHLADFSVGAMVSNAIVGANIPIATGSAMAFRLRASTASRSASSATAPPTSARSTRA